MNNKLDRLNDIKVENFIWIIYIGIIILSWYANSKEKKYILYNDEKSKKEYQNLMIFIFTILLFFNFSTLLFFSKNYLKVLSKSLAHNSYNLSCILH